MIGLAVGIDYALFILSRHRTQLAAGMDPEESAARAVGTAGSAVVFAGLTVIIALSRPVGRRHPVPRPSMGVGAAGTVLVAVLVALTLLPALLGFAGAAAGPEARLARRPARAGRRRARRTGAGGSMGARWTRLVTRRPLLTVLAVLAGLLVARDPGRRSCSWRCPDNSTAAPDTPQRQAYDLITRELRPRLQRPAGRARRGPRPGDGPAVGRSDRRGHRRHAHGHARGVRGRSGRRRRRQPSVLPDGTTGLITVIPESGPQDEATEDLVGRPPRPAPGPRGGDRRASIAVTGQTAVAIDVSDRLGDALLPFALVVVGLALVLLLLVFRSILVPIKAAVGFLLSVGAAFGAVVAVFQWGWLGDLLGVPSRPAR